MHSIQPTLSITAAANRRESILFHSFDHEVSGCGFLLRCSVVSTAIDAVLIGIGIIIGIEVFNSAAAVYSCRELAMYVKLLLLWVFSLLVYYMRSLCRSLSQNTHACIGIHSFSTKTHMKTVADKERFDLRTIESTTDNEKNDVTWWKVRESAPASATGRARSMRNYLDSIGSAASSPTVVMGPQSMYTPDILKTAPPLAVTGRSRNYLDELSSGRVRLTQQQPRKAAIRTEHMSRNAAAERTNSKAETNERIKEETRRKVRACTIQRRTSAIHWVHLSSSYSIEFLFSSTMIESARGGIDPPTRRGREAIGACVSCKETHCSIMVTFFRRQYSPLLVFIEGRRGELDSSTLSGRESNGT
jgi:hypothetical protein